MTYKVNCERISSAMIPYLDGRASAAEQSAVESHAAVCPECRERIEEFRKLFGVLNEMPLIEPSGAFDARLRERISAEPRRNVFDWFMPAPRLAFALAMLLALSVWMGKFQQADNSVATSQSEQDFHVIKDLGVLENYDVLKGFDALSELPVSTQEPAQPQQEQPQKDGQI
ncbi:MAG: zf-HC2 domain-containing protein [Candidatus Acidiferrales bacterium]